MRNKIIVKCENCGFEEPFMRWVRRGSPIVCPKCKKPYKKPDVQKEDKKTNS
ncbi:unnamed protein product [marine sediment metagenome]|uniref:Uncharacterized protein n=1 Tax=marine sediment metagenome TaxID=412755 RepID=X1N930_9ZZZZ